MLEAQPRRGFEAQAVGHRPVGGPLQVGALQEAPAGHLRRGVGAVGRDVEQRQQRQARRLERHLVAHGLAAQAQLAVVGSSGKPPTVAAPPLEAVEAREHRAAQVERFRCRRPAEEAQPQRHAVVDRDLGHLAQAQRARQPGARHRVARQAPQRADARKEHEQQHHRRRADQRGARGQAAGAAQARLPDRHVRQHERGEQPPHRHEHGRSHRHRLRIQEVREHEEEAEEEHHERIAPRAQLQRLEHHEHDEHRDAGFLAEQRAVGG